MACMILSLVLWRIHFKKIMEAKYILFVALPLDCTICWHIVCFYLLVTHVLKMAFAGMQETGTKLAEFCAHALLALEVLIHPRALPLIDFPSANNNSFDGIKSRFPENLYSAGQKQNNPFSSGTLGKGPADPDSDDELYKSWLGNGDEIQVPEIDLEKNLSYAEESLETVKDPSAEKLLSVGGSSSKKIPEENEQGPAAAVATDWIGGNVDEIMVESQQIQGLDKQSQEPISQVGTMPAVDCGSTGAQFGTIDAETAPGKDALAAEGDRSPTTGEKTIATASNSDRGKASVFELDDDLSTDSIPDIVDGDPDSD
uniref:Putative proline-, glutamic acid-and leucine-rich protein 1 n=1 Tax=Davidia involucrata TaxID=16924 RepID=A0A5B7ARE6_DAVIN